MENEDGSKREEESALVQMARLSGHGMTLAVSTGLFLLIGWWVDGKLGTTPVLTILGALLGAAAGFYSILQHLILGPRARERERAARTERPGGREPPER
jgi:F0F1-type ATP synthase assembly protein I